MDVPRTRSPWLKAIGAEGAIVTLLLGVLGFFYLRPASSLLIRGDASAMLGDGTDSVTNPWQYRLVVDVFESRPQDLLFGAVYSDQMGAPEGAAHFIPFIERILAVLYAPFMRTDLMPTAVVWGLMILSGLCFHAYGRVLGWPRPVAFALAIAWAFCPFTRARALVHIAFVGTYWAPLFFLAVHVLARPPERISVRGATIAAAGLMLFAVFSAHYFVVLAAIMAPAFLLYYFLLLPRSVSRVAALGRLAVAVAPAVLFVVWSLAMPVPSYGARALAGVVATRSETDQFLKNYGAHPMDYVLGDVKLGDRDLNPWRSKLTHEARAEVPDNRHERSNGIRWSVLATCAALAVTLGVRRLRRRLSPIERALGGFAFVLAGAAFLFALSPQGLRVYDVDLGPVQLVAKVLPRFRVPNRMGTLVHFAALLGAGVFLTRVLRKPIARGGFTAVAAGVALPAVMVLDYAPLHDVVLTPMVAQRDDLEAAGAAGGRSCGSGITVPYVTWGFHDEDYYKTYTSLRGTSCKILHSAYLTQEDERLRLALGKATYADADRLAAERVARCAGASWVIFRLDASDELKRRFCADMGWSFVGADACRAPTAMAPPVPRSLRDCVP